MFLFHIALQVLENRLDGFVASPLLDRLDGFIATALYSLPFFQLW